MMNRKKVLILIAAILGLGIVLTTPLSNISRLGMERVKPTAPKELLDVDEINAFLVVWSEFAQKDISRSMAQISLSSSGEIPTRVIRWLYARGWDAQRFFVVEQRLRELVAIATLQNSLEDNRKLMSKMSGGNLKDIVASQENQLKAQKYNPQELALVRGNLYQISQVLEGKGVVK